MKIDDSFKYNLKKILDYIPFVSTISNTIQLVVNKIFNQTRNVQGSSETNLNGRNIVQKSTKDCQSLAIPFYNIFYAKKMYKKIDEEIKTQVMKDELISILNEVENHMVTLNDNIAEIYCDSSKSKAVDNSEAISLYKENYNEFIKFINSSYIKYPSRISALQKITPILWEKNLQSNEIKRMREICITVLRYDFIVRGVMSFPPEYNTMKLGNLLSMATAKAHLHNQ